MFHVSAAIYKMTMGDLHGRGMVQSTGVGAPMIAGGVALYTTSRGTEHNNASHQRYLDCLDLENFIRESYGKKKKKNHTHWLSKKFVYL